MKSKVQSPIKVLMLSAVLGSSVAIGLRGSEVFATYSASECGIVESITNQSDDVLFFEALFRTPANKRDTLKNVLSSMNHELDLTEVIQFSGNLEVIVAAFAGSKKGSKPTRSRTTNKSRSESFPG